MTPATAAGTDVDRDETVQDGPGETIATMTVGGNDAGTIGGATIAGPPETIGGETPTGEIDGLTIAGAILASVI
jgi:hypothetical protein